MTDTRADDKTLADFYVYSDLFKDLHGFRPRGVFEAAFLESPEAERRATLDRVSRGLEQAIREEREEVSADHRDQAEWWADLLGLTEDDRCQDAGR